MDVGRNGNVVFLIVQRDEVAGEVKIFGVVEMAVDIAHGVLSLNGRLNASFKRRKAFREVQFSAHGFDGNLDVCFFQRGDRTGVGLDQAPNGYAFDQEVMADVHDAIVAEEEGPKALARIGLNEDFFFVFWHADDVEVLLGDDPKEAAIQGEASIVAHAFNVFDRGFLAKKRQ